MFDDLLENYDTGRFDGFLVKYKTDRVMVLKYNTDRVMVFGQRITSTGVP